METTFSGWDTNSELVTIEESKISKYSLLEETVDVLTRIGLPLEIGFLNFDPLKNGQLSLEGNRNQYLKIGFNGSGDSIVINLRDGDSICYLNHDNFDEEVFIDTNLMTFCKAAQIVGDFEAQITPLNDDSTFFTEFSDEAFEQLKNDLRDVDPKIFRVSNSHWDSHIMELLELREEEREQ